ncbi:hypothetical protein GCM10022287_06460 [Gryllotalpicola koreensis]|uniref:Metallo-beta-lactamase domain-containing protein n=1 Tax=Gryllotalpicola koreensis TaxID=993086 RepID=A0ABP7ZT21_9MICO
MREHAHADPLAVVGRPRRLVPLVLGHEPIPEAVSLEGGSASRQLREPVTAAAIEFDRGWLLVDGGFSPAVHDPAHRASFVYGGYAPIVPSGDPLCEQLDAAGLELDRLAGLLLSHAHFDHTGGARLLSEHRPLLLQRREWEYVIGVDDARSEFVFPDDLIRPDLSVVLIDGDAVIAPGVSVLDTAGHTPGHQSVVVDLPGHTVVLAGDAADLRANIELRAATGSTVAPDGRAAARAAITRLADLDASSGTTVWPSHDPDWGPWRDVVEPRA